MINVAGKCVECGQPGVNKYPPHTKCLCALHQTVSDIVSQTTDDAVRVIAGAPLEALDIARTRLLCRRNATVKLKAIGVRTRMLEREALARMKEAGR